MKNIIHILASISLGFICQSVLAAEPVQLQNPFSVDEVKWATEKGDAIVSGKAVLKLKDGTTKGCAYFNVELLPVAKYSNERILKTYGNNEKGQILLEDNPPKFTPDAKEYHEMLLKSSCNSRHQFTFMNVPAGEYYAIAFIIWDVSENGTTSKTGGAVMKRIKVKAKSKTKVVIKA